MLDVAAICNTTEEMDRKARKYAWQQRTSTQAVSTALC